MILKLSSQLPQAFANTAARIRVHPLDRDRGTLSNMGNCGSSPSQAANFKDFGPPRPPGGGTQQSTAFSQGMQPFSPGGPTPLVNLAPQHASSPAPPPPPAPVAKEIPTVMSANTSKKTGEILIISFDIGTTACKCEHSVLTSSGETECVHSSRMRLYVSRCEQPDRVSDRGHLALRFSLVIEAHRILVYLLISGSAQRLSINGRDRRKLAVKRLPSCSIQTSESIGR
jgi:hypothetical protein